MANKYSAIYYPECYVGDSRSLTTYLLLYDELHLVALSDDARNPTVRFRDLPEYSVVTSIRAGGVQKFSVSSREIRSNVDVGEINAQTKRVLRFYQFVQRYKSLIGEALFFHPHVLASFLTRARDRIISGRMTCDEFTDVVTGQDKDILAFQKFQDEFPGIRDEAIWRIVPTALRLAEEKELLLVGDDLDIPVPVLSNNIPSVKMLTSVLAQECIKIYVPSCREVESSDILEIRDSLSEALVPFRLSLQKLSGDLRAALTADVNLEQIYGEAKFIAESKIEPAVFELRQCIEKSNSKVFNKVFGKIVSWVPFIAKAYSMPTPDSILNVAKKIGADTGALLDAVDDASYTQRQGLSFLLKVEDVMGQRSKG